MAKKYLVWKNKISNGENPEWLELNGIDFFRFLNSNESKGRYFIVLGNDICADADILYLEATEEQYRKWYKENCHHQYLKKHQPKENILSLDTPNDEDESSSLHDFIADINVDVEAEVIGKAFANLLPVAISTLSDIFREAILLKYFKYPKLSDREIAERIGVTEDTFVKRKNRALKKLLDFLKK